MEIQSESRVYRLHGLTELLGGLPACRELREKYVIAKAPSEEMREEEAAMMDIYERDEKGVTVFARNRREQLCVMDRHVKAFFKDSLTTLKAQTGVASAQSKVNRLLFIEPRYIPIKRDGVPLVDEDEVLERPQRISGMTGDTMTLKASELVADPWEIEFEVTLIQNVSTGKSKALTWDAIECALDYGARYGLGQWRNAGYGSFRWEEVTL